MRLSLRPGSIVHIERGTDVALVRFSGGGGNPGSIGAVTLEAAGQREPARWEHGEGELPEALAVPIWGRYGLFHGHPRITAIVTWDAQQRQVLMAGKRGHEKLDEMLLEPPRQAAAPPHARHVAGRRTAGCRSRVLRVRPADPRRRQPGRALLLIGHPSCGAAGWSRRPRPPPGEGLYCLPRWRATLRPAPPGGAGVPRAATGHSPV